MENTNNNATKGNGFNVKIITAGKKLALLNPNAPELKSAREWFKGGCISKYSNQDCDILQSLISASSRIEKGWN